jgi:hypothetical protein
VVHRRQPGETVTRHSHLTVAEKQKLGELICMAAAATDPNVKPTTDDFQAFLSSSLKLEYSRKQPLPTEPTKACTLLGSLSSAVLISHTIQRVFNSPIKMPTVLVFLTILSD